MNQRSLRVLEYPKIIDRLMACCITDGGKGLAGALEPFVHREQIDRELKLTAEALDMTMRNGQAPLAALGDTRDLVHRAVIGSMLSMGELLEIAGMLRVTRDMENYYYEDVHPEDIQVLKNYFESLDPCLDLEEEISRKILTSEEMADNASRKLAEIRREIMLKNGRITEKLNAIIGSSANEKYLQDRIVTIRNNRYVVPVKQEYRSQIPGIILDRSSSGATVFVEPMSVVELNNDLKLLATEEEKEVTRILRELSDKVAAYKEVLINDNALLGELDFIFAKGKLGIQMDGVRVALDDADGPMHFLRARHPLLDVKKAVASDITMESGTDTIVITGPNTGGKTVTLKTIGLLTLMVQSGLFVPVREKSRTRVYQEVFADIGDEQSIEQNLSTFSAHMKNIVEIMGRADDQSLVLFDELGAGTDPTEGAALAIALLDNLHRRHAVTVATTHYSELKEYALMTPGIMNASVEFDVQTLRPTFRLIMGIPGKSNAFEIATRLGLSLPIIESAKSHVTKESVRFEETLEKIEEKRSELERVLAETREREAEIERVRHTLEEDQAANEARCRRMIEEAQAQSRQIVEDTEKKTEAIYQKIRLIQESTKSGAIDNKDLEALRKEMKDHAKKVSRKYHRGSRKPSGAARDIPLEVGTAVYLDNLNKEGEILELSDRDSKVIVQVGPMKIKVDRKDITPKEKSRPNEGYRPRKMGQGINGTDRHVMNARLDLRGRTAEEALFLVEKLVSDAVVSGTHELQVIHGKGTGKLRQVIQDYLKDNPLVSEYRYGAPNEGGTGVTIIKM